MTGGHCLACTAGSGSGCQGALTGESACPRVNDKKDAKETVKEYYGKVLKTGKDLKTSACCSVETFPEPVKTVLKNIEPEILAKFYGCGSPIPPLLEGRKVLDLGSGTGRDVYIVSSLAGETGFSTGIDMTEEQLAVAEKHKAAQMKRFGFRRCNVAFKKGYIEDLKEAGIGDSSQDVVISNCVINLSPEKRKVFSEIFRVLKPGGELYFSDVFADRRVPEEVKSDPVLYGECLGGALYIEDFRRILREAGCPDYRVVSTRKLTVDDPRLAAALGNIAFYSMTIRAFKLADLEDICEDYGQVAYYQGTIPYHQHQFALDDHHLFIAHKPMLVCGNTAAMLSGTRYGKHFRVVGDTAVHYGAFPCGPAPRKDGEAGGGSCC
ncbi:MAG: methyltransferase domain-containing protein [Elusimicrobia bacterium]|nr:methyltransferase domain-containing protein [Elusimicrobiota bacterium]